MNAKTTAVLVWIAIALGVVAYAAAGTSKVLGVEQMAQSFTHFHLPLWFMTFIGACEIAGAIGLLIRRLSALAAVGLAIIMIGAIVPRPAQDRNRVNAFWRALYGQAAPGRRCHATNPISTSSTAAGAAIGGASYVRCM